MSQPTSPTSPTWPSVSLIDFGLPAKTIMDGLEWLDELRSGGR